MNRADLIKKMNVASSELLHEKGYISFVDILMRMDKLRKEDYESWRFRKEPYLEKVVTINLARLSHMLRTFHQNGKKGGLRPSEIAYVSWGKGTKRPLRFSKSGELNIEKAYSTHFLRSKEGV